MPAFNHTSGKHTTVNVSHACDLYHLTACMKEPVLFRGTVRYNLDPMEKYTDAELWSVLEKVGNGYDCTSCSK